MKVNSKIIGLGAVAAMAAMQTVPAMANVQVWDFDSSNQSFNFSGDGNSLSMTSSDGVNLTVTGWSDTNDSSGPDEIETAQLILRST